MELLLSLFFAILGIGILVCVYPDIYEHLTGIPYDLRKFAKEENNKQ